MQEVTDVGPSNNRELVVIAGARGLVGTPTAEAFRRAGYEVRALAHADLDICDETAVARWLEDERPGSLVNCAAYTKVDDCEKNIELSMRVNGAGAGVLARQAARIGAAFVHLSTDYVFDGRGTRPYREDDATAPMESLSAYGRSKLAGERAVVAGHPSPLIIRTAWVYGPDGPGFPNAILRGAREKPRLKVVNDQTGSPTYAPDLAEAIAMLARRGATGFVNVTNAGTCTWFEFASEIVRLSGLTTPVDPCTTAEFPRPARRPAYSVLDNSRYVSLVGKPLRHWREAIAEFMRAMV